MPIVGPNSSTRTFVVGSTIGTDMSPGPLQQTGRPLDVYVNGSGWIAVRAADQTEAYTRDGGLQLSANGVLQTHSGLDVIGEGGTIVVPPNNTVAIGGDGTVSIIPTDGLPNAVSIVGRIKLVNPPQGGMVRGGDGLFRQGDGRSAAARCRRADHARRARRQQRERGADAGGNDQLRAPVRHPDEAAADRGERRPRLVQHPQPVLVTEPLRIPL